MKSGHDGCPATGALDVFIFTMAKNKIELDIYSKIGIKSSSKVNKTDETAEARGGGERLVCEIALRLASVIEPKSIRLVIA